MRDTHGRRTCTCTLLKSIGKKTGKNPTPQRFCASARNAPTLQRDLTNAISNCRVLPPLDAPAHSNAKLKTLNKTTVTVDRNAAPIAATTHSANRYGQANKKLHATQTIDI